MLILVFDTETTGLPTERNASIFDNDKWPYIVQLSYIIYDTIKNVVVELFDNIIDINDNGVISEESIKIHGITKEISKSKGMPIKLALEKFNNDVQKVDKVVGHNISFDKRVIMVECMRNKVQQQFNYNKYKKPEYCTMKNAIDICKLERINKTGEKYFKYPSLSELYYNLFGEIPNGTHNALIDIIVCLRCYIKLVYDQDVKSDFGIKYLFDKYDI
jgi:DNA polymerase III epsilon subunit-like protein